MNILIICHRLPFPFTTNALSYRILNSVKYLSKKFMHNIIMVGFKDKYDSIDYLKEYCDEIITMDLPTQKMKLVDYIIGIFTGYISLRKGNVLNYSFSWKLQKKVTELVITKEIDIIFVDTPSMLYYASDVSLPKIIEIWSIPQIHYEAFKFERNIPKKIPRLLNFLAAKHYEKSYEKYDVCITPTEQEKDVLNLRLSNLNISVIHFGINLDLRSNYFVQDFPSLLFLGNMGDKYNQRSILYFYNNIYYLIKDKIPNIKLYIVGKDPSEDILKLTNDASVIVTGYVDDVRPYLARASVVTLPIHGYGIKTRVLEAMAMEKAVVISSKGIHGINVMPEKDIIIADDPTEFARRVIELLNDENLRYRISSNARKLMEEEYSWEKMTDKLNDVLLKAMEIQKSKK
jgi:glycosyltransferase involved in cell wall biosynthesis